MITVLLWAAARDAVGASRTEAEAGSVAEVLAALVVAHPRLGDLLPRCRIVVDGELVAPARFQVGDGSTLEVLPPYAGG